MEKLTKTENEVYQRIESLRLAFGKATDEDARQMLREHIAALDEIFWCMGESKLYD